MKLTLTVLIILALAGGGAFLWKEAAPVIAELKEKDPEKFALTVLHLKSFHFTEAIKGFTELDKMSYEQVLTVRYLARKKKVQNDDDFRLRQREEEFEAREATREIKKEARQDQMRDLILLAEKRPVLKTDWDRSGPWKQGLLLREKCVKYLQMEKSSHRGVKQIHMLPRIAPLLNRPREQSLTVPEICEEFVPISHDEMRVALALETLKIKMDYFFFVQLLDEIGVPRQDVFSFPSQLDRMTGGYAGS